MQTRVSSLCSPEKTESVTYLSKISCVPLAFLLVGGYGHDFAVRKAEHNLCHRF